MSSRRPSVTRAWLTAADLVLVGLVSLAVVIFLLAGGTRFVLAGIRVSFTDPWRFVAAAGVLAVLRVMFARDVPFLAGLLDRAARERTEAERLAFARPPATPQGVKYYAAAAAVAALLSLWPHLLHIRSVPDPGDPFFNAWRVARIAHQLTHDPRHLFDGNIFYPAPLTLTYSDPTFLEGVAGAPFISAGADPLIVSNAIFLSAFPLCALAFFFAAWRLTSDPRAAFVAGVLGGLYPFHTEHYSHLELQFFLFVPLAMVAMLRMFAAPRWSTGLKLGAAIAGQWLACLYFGVMLITFLVPFALVIVAAWGVRPSRKLVEAVVAAGGILVLGLLLIGIPFMRSRSARGERTIDIVGFYSAEPADYGHPHGRLASYRWVSRRDNMPERELFPGLMVLTLAAAGTCPPLAVPAIAALVSGALSFDWSLGVHGMTYVHLYRWVLPYRTMRVPARFSVFVGSPLILLAAYGCRRVIRLAPVARGQTSVFIVLAALALVDLRPAPTLREYWPTTPPIYAAVTPEMVLAEFPMRVDHNIAYMYFSTRHWARLINGYSGYTPERYASLEQASRDFPSAALLNRLRGEGATHVTVNCVFYVDRCGKILNELDANAGVQLVARGRWEGAEVRLYAIR